MLDVLQGSEYGSESVAFTQSNNRGSRVKFVGKKAEGQISKRVLQEKKARQIFRKTNISHPLILTRTLLTDVRLGCKYCVLWCQKKETLYRTLVWESCYIFCFVSSHKIFLLEEELVAKFVLESLFNEVLGLVFNFIKKETPAQLFS